MRTAAEKRIRERNTFVVAGAVLIFGASGACDLAPEDLAGGPQRPSEIESHASAASSTLVKQWGWNFTTPDKDSNRCVKHAQTVLNRMNSHGENIGIHYKAAGYTDTDGTKWHAQSIVRLPFYDDGSSLKGQWFVEDVDHPMGGASQPDSEGHLGVARMDFTGGRSGRLLGSNKTFNDGYNGSDWLVAPNPGDSFVAVNGTKKFHVDEVQNHVGGMSGIGKYVAISLMQWVYNPGGDAPSGSRPLVKIFDHSNPDHPVLKQAFTAALDPSGGKNGNDAVAITKLRDGRFLMAVEKGFGLSRTELYVSNGTSLDTPNVFGADLRAPDATVAGYRQWTSMNFITDCDSSDMYIIGFNSNGKVEMKRLDLFQDSVTRKFSVSMYDPPNEEGIPPVASKTLACTDNQGNGQCALESSAGTYVDPYGNVIFYVMGGDDDGCIYSPSSGSLCGNNVRGKPYLIHGNGSPTPNNNFSASTGYMRGMEFHERHGNYAPGSDCPTMDTAWVELYENANFNSAVGDMGRNYYWDGANPTAKPSYSLGPNYFNDLTTSVRWCLPPGKSFTLFSAVNFLQSSHVLSGTGYVQGIANLSGKNYAHGGGSMNNSISSYQFNDTDNDPLHDVGVGDDTI